MSGRRRLLAGVLVVGIVVVASSFVGGAVSYGLLTDTEAGQATVTAADSFGGGGPPNDRAYNDANGNGRYDAGESTYTESDLYNFEDESANLVVPESMNTVRNRNEEISITANSITVETDIRSRNGGVVLESTGGGIDASGQTLRSRNEGVEITSSGPVDISDATIRSRNEAVVVESGDRIDAQRVDIRSRNGDIEFTSVGDIDLTDAKLDGRNGAKTADLGTASATLTVDGAEIEGKSTQTLRYGPSGVTVDGSPAKGSVAPD